jgi:hypothetical protein
MSDSEDSNTNLEKRKPSEWWRIPRTILFLLGIVSLSWFFFSFIAIVIGLMLFAVFKDLAWKRNGVILAFAGGIAVFLQEMHYLLWGMAIPLAMIFFSGVLIVSHDVIRWILKKAKNRPYRDWERLLQKIPSKIALALKLFAIVLPIFLWSIVSIDLFVMFDNNPRLLWIHAPSTVEPSTEFEFTIEAWDSYERLSATYKGTVEFSLKSYHLTTYNLFTSINPTLPNSYTFTGQLFGSTVAYLISDGRDNGRHVFNATINDPGIHYILIKDSITGNTYYSNPIKVEDTDSHIYWGDLHTHSMISDGSGSAEHSYFYARYIACLDYYSLTDHGEHLDLLGFSINGPNLYPVLQSVTNNAYEPTKFVTFHGVEWTTGYITSLFRNYGHYTCIASGNDLPLISANAQKNTSELWDYLDLYTSTSGNRILALPHHTVRAQFIQDWTYMNPKYVKLAEVTSVHGESLFEPRHMLNYRGCVDNPPEYVNGSSIVDAYIMGKRMALIAGSDEHDGHPGHSLSHTPAYIGHQWPLSIWHARNGHPYPGGITAVYANNLTRKAVFNGLDNQRVFANSDHGRPLLFFTINGVGVGDGSTITVSNPTADRNIEVFLAQDGAPAATKYTPASVNSSWIPNWRAGIEIIRNGELIYNETVSTPVVKITHTDSDAIEGASYAKSCIKIGDNYFINSYSENPIDPSTLNTGGSDFYLVRVVGANGRTSYAGPIWVEY